METSPLMRSENSSSCFQCFRNPYEQDTLIFLFTGALSGLINSISDVVWDEEKEIEVLYGTLIGAGLGAIGGWVVEGSQRIFAKCCACCSSETPDTQKLMGRTCKEACIRFWKKPALVLATQIFAGMSAGFSDDLSEWEFEPIQPQLRDLAIGAGVGLVAAVTELILRKFSNCCRGRREIWSFVDEKEDEEV